MTDYYVATLARYVLVKAVDENVARRLGHEALYKLTAGLRERKEAPINIVTVRPATEDELALQRFYDDGMAREAEMRSG